MAELFLEMTQWKNFMSASAWVQVLDFTKRLVYSNCQNDRKCCFFSMYAFYHLCLFTISGGFDALHQLSVKKDPLEIQHPKLESSRRGPFMRDNGRCDILHAA